MVELTGEAAKLGTTTLANNDWSTAFRLPAREEAEEGAGPIRLLPKLTFSRHGRYCYMYMYIEYEINKKR